MKAAIVQRARELGFEDCRITTAAPPESAHHFQDWIAGDRHGEMAYLARNAEKRVEPQRVLAGSKSVICLAVAYSADRIGSVVRSQWSGVKQADVAPQLTTDNGQRTNGTVARYACFTDYHDVLGEKLKLLCDLIGALSPEARSLWYVDTGPLLERDLAQRAGLGFIGKHTNVISRRLGNWIFLAEIITTLELEPDAPEKNRCGSCTRCITACPTNAITAPFQLDARRCISYLTIELKGAIPIELRPAIGNRIFGCDDCLAVCPWNKFAEEGRLMKQHSRSDLQQPDLIELLSLDDVGFQSRFGNTPLSRPKRRGLLRNACVALGNVGDSRALPALERASRDPEPLIAEHARWAIGRIQKS
jgi:epoxyqueuosine reductase